LELCPGVDLPRSRLEAELLLKRKSQLEENTATRKMKDLVRRAAFSLG